MNDIIIKVAIAVFVVPVVGALIRGLDRMITARLQSRVGPPLLQPVYDIIKLLRKEPIVANRVQVLYVVLHLVFIIMATVMLFLGQDGLIFLFVLAFSTLWLVLGGMSVRSPYSRIGSMREIFMMAAYEPILILTIVGFYMVNGSFMMGDAFAHNVPVLFKLPLIFLAYLMVVAVKMQKSPFDLATSHHAHQEIVKGITIEYSGPYLALIEIGHCYETVLFLAWIAFFCAGAPYLAVALIFGAFMGAIVLDNVSARLTTVWMFRFMWTFGLVLALTNIMWLCWR